LTIWLILIMAAIGFGFDIYVLLVMQYIGPGSMAELLPGVTPGSEAFNHWRGLLFFVPAFVGGLVGLVGGYLTDLFGRRRVLTGSILLYALATFASAFSTSIVMLLVFRCLTFAGVCVEFVAAVAWLAELFPNHDQRERALGYTQAFSSFGGLTVSVVFTLMTQHAPDLPPLLLPDALAAWLGQVNGAHAAWRYTLLFGVIPAIPLILIRPFLPESPTWKEKKLAGTLKRPSFRELFAPYLRRTTLVTTLMFACSYGAAFGAIQQVPFMIEAMPTYEKKAEHLPKLEQTRLRQGMAGQFGTVQEVGGLVGRFILAYLAVYIVGRRSLLRIFQLPGLIVVPLVFAFAITSNRVLIEVPAGGGSSVEITLFHIGIFFAGLFTVAQFSFWGNYLPRVYPLHLRGTGESFAANIGGRMIGTSFAWVTSELSGMKLFSGSDSVRMAYTAAAVALFVYLVGSVACCFLPEPKEGIPLD
jgi:MFS family permease